jgi:hypothetical protein
MMAAFLWEEVFLIAVQVVLAVIALEVALVKTCKKFQMVNERF